MFNLHKHVFAKAHFPRYGNQENDQRLMFLKKGVGV